jgi:hypothetical protein
MITPRFRPFFIALIALLVPGAVFAQTPNKAKTAAVNQLAQTRAELIEATEKSRASAQEVVHIQEQEIEAATKKLEQLRQLVGEGLIARNELTGAEEELAAARGKLESTRKEISESDNLIAQVREAEAAEKKLAQTLASQAAASKKLLRLTAMRYNGMAGWALANISSVQSFFNATFGRQLPISTFGQSNTHNAMRWDHRNSVDVGLHPDSTEGRALIGFLQSKGIPFLAFRGAVPGVSTGPHIHIGYPSSRLS